ncbi:MAG TPA: thioredoxin [bacterium]|nr:thioredoxin [bacterium]
MAEIIFTDSNFATETEKGVSVIDFWAPWCGPCRMQGPIVDRIAADFQNRAKIGKMNVDENRATPGKFGISGIPTILIIKDGVEVQRFVGVQQQNTLKAAIENHLN